jgi:membrane protease YdiL (CAAX protease family)
MGWIITVEVIWHYLIILVLAPTFEELGWRGYGVDSLKKGRSIMKATLIYAFYGIYGTYLCFLLMVIIKMN